MTTNTRDRSEILRLVRNYANAKEEPIFVPGETLIPTSGRVVGQEEVINLVEAALDTWLTAGRFNEEFELNLAKFVGTKKAITVNSGSSANLVAFMTLTSPQLGERAILPGDEVITVAAGFPTTVNPIIQASAVPVFVDVTLPTYNIDVNELEAALSLKTKAIMIAHTLGNPFNVKAIKDFCETNKLWLIEDCCDALGSKFEGRNVGTFGDLATLSFYPAHHITTGQGGAVLTSDPLLAKIAQSISEWGRDCWCPPGKSNTCGKRFCQKFESLPEGFDHKYIYSHLGYSLRMTDMQASCGVAQLSKIGVFGEKRRRNFGKWISMLSAINDKLLLPSATPNSDPSWFGLPLTILPTAEIYRADLIQHLNSKAIDTRMLFAGDLRSQPYMERVKYRCVGNLSNTKLIMNNTFWVGLYPGITDSMIEYASREIISFFNF